MTSLSELYRRGYEIDWDGFNRPWRRSRISLPTSPFERQRFWLDGDRSAVLRSRRANAEEPAGERLRSALPESQFEARYGLNLLPYLDDHRIYGLPVLPMTGAIAALVDAARRHFGTGAVALENFQYREALVLPEAGERIVQTILTPIDATTAECRLASIDDKMNEGWRTHVVCLARKDAPAALEERPVNLDLGEARKRCATSIAPDRYYRTVRALGLEYGPAFRGIETLLCGEGEVLARIVMPDALGEPSSFLHAALLDACLHTYAALAEPRPDFDAAADRPRGCYLPIDFERFDGGGGSAREVWVRSVRRPGPEGADKRFTADITIHASDGRPIAHIRGLSLKFIPPETFAAREPGKVDWLYQMRWTEAPLPPRPEARAGDPGGWLILADRNGVGARLAGLLRERGDACRVVLADDLAGAGGDDADFMRACQKLAAEAGAQSERMRGVLSLWSLDLPAGALAADRLEQAQRLVLGSALFLLQALVEPSQASSAAPRLWLVTRNAMSVSPDDSPCNPASAALWGFGRSAALEHPQLWGGLVDLGAEASPSEEAARLLSEILDSGSEDQIALRDNGGRFAPRLVRMQPPPRTEVKPDAEGTYLITGGLGALGVETARWLISRRGAKHLVLASRRGFDDPKAGMVVDELSAIGAEVRIVSADITKEADVRRLLEVAGSPRELKGIFHCAGLLDDGILLQMSWAKLWRVMAPKAIGGWLLSELSRDLKLECFVVFSSILSLIGSAGQANYSAANAFLDGLVGQRRAEGLPALALNFGPWARSGLATESGEKGRQIWRARGTEYIPASLGVEALDAAVGEDVVEVALRIRAYAGAGGLRELGVDPAVLPECADAAVARPQLKLTPPAADRDEILALYERAL
jgi:acyl transferase domain-containing protein